MSEKAKPRILIIYTGGTIGMIEDAETGTLCPFDFDHLIDNVPKIRMLDYEIEHLSFDEPIDSSDMNIECWQRIAKSIGDNYDSFDGFVVLHGTDTMAYTASALSFMLGHVHKPVIITGSQLPIGEVRTDGEENLITALQIAAAKDSTGWPMVREVAILFENYLWRGNRSTKTSADNFNAFKSNNYPPLAHIGLGIKFNTEVLWRTPVMHPLDIHYNLDPSVIVVDLFPGITEENLRYQLAAPGIKGFILKTYGAGNAPTYPWFQEAITEAIGRGTVILNVTQCPSGGIHDRRYYAGDRLVRCGVVSGHDITLEAAITKMMYLFGLGISSKEVANYLSMPLCGEMTL